MYNDDEVVILLIEDSDDDVKTFQFQILKHPSWRYKTKLVHKKTIAEGRAWLAKQAIAPYLVCIDIGMDGINLETLPGILRQIKKYVPEDSLIAFTDDDRDSLLKIRLEQEVGKDKIFEATNNNQEQLLSAIQKIVGQRSSGRSREMQMDIVRFEGKIESIEDELTRLIEVTNKLHDAVFMGGGDGRGSLAYLVFQHNKILEDIPPGAIASLKKRIDAIEEERSQGSLQVVLSRMAFRQKIFLVLLGVIFSAASGLLGEELIDIIKTVLGN